MNQPLNYLRTIAASTALLFSLLSAAQQIALPDSIPLRILIIRHGEKPDTGYNLNCQGWNRARVLPKAIMSQFGEPKMIYVPDMKTGKKTKSVRMYQTVIPFAIKYNLLVNSKFDETDSTEIAGDLKVQKGTYLVVWDKKNILPMVRNLGIQDPALNWPDNDYDSIWIIEFIKNAEGSLIPKLTRGRENIVPSKDCE